MEKKIDINVVYEEFLRELFGSVPEDVSSQEVKRSEYTKAMKAVQERHGLKQGHPDFVGWVFTLVGRSPMIIEDNEKGAGEDEPTSTTES
jgi:hypothetical protein